MLDVHPPHESVHNWRDFLIHLLTITIGLFIALLLEGCVERQHQRHLVHDAQEGLHIEIKHNAEAVKRALDDVHKQQADLKHDVVVLNSVIRTGKVPPKDSMEIGFHLSVLDDVSWRTAQSTGALGYMSYATAQDYASIYTLQDELLIVQRQAARDAILSLAPFTGTEPDDDKPPTREEAIDIRSRVETLEGQMLLLESLLKSLDGEYKKFLQAHP